jgi:hypothetical protein
MFFAATKPPNPTRDEAAEKLWTYMAAKKQQMRSDRSLGLLLDERREIVHMIAATSLTVGRRSPSRS